LPSLFLFTGEAPDLPMKTWIQRRSEALKVVGLWLACLMVLCGIWLASILYFLENAREVNAVRIAANRIRIHELEARRAEKDFILRDLSYPLFFRDGRSEYLGKHRATMSALRSEIENLGKRSPRRQQARAQHLLEMVDRYESGFQELVSAYRKRGFEGWGIEGALQGALGGLKQAVERSKDPTLSRGISKLVEDEQGFLRDRSPEKADQVIGDLALLRETLLEETIREESPAVLESVKDYEVAFGKLRDIEERIGFTEELGLEGELRKAIHAVEPALEEILDEAVRNDEDANQTLLVGLLLTCFIMAILLALAIFFAQSARLRNKRLVRVHQQMEEEHRRLLQAERLAAIGQMVTGLAHESRNAFQRTHACLDMLSQEAKDQPEILDLVARIEESQDHIHHLFEEVREYAAPVRLKHEPARLEEVVRSAWERLDLLCKAREVHFNQSLDGTDLRCEVDRFGIEQVFRNIFENSLAACRDPVEIEVRYREQKLSANPALEISASDNGPGLDPEQREKIFEPFYTTKTKGTGLGMAIAKRIVEAHGGAIEVGSTRRQGAEIVVTLPRQATGRT
jgi:signal transduction histidine kinase